MSPVQPSATNKRQVRMSVAIVIPEIGFDEEPISPVMRDDTVAKKNPKISTSSAAMTLPWVGRPGTTIRNRPSSTLPPRTMLIGMSRSVRNRAAAPPAAAPKSRRLPRAEAIMVGIVRDSVMRPDASTAPAPMYRMYALHSYPGAISEMRNGRPVAGLLAKLGWMGGKGSVM